jgi:hypothetical protein
VYSIELRQELSKVVEWEKVTVVGGVDRRSGREFRIAERV